MDDKPNTEKWLDYASLVDQLPELEEMGWTEEILQKLNRDKLLPAIRGPKSNRLKYLVPVLLDLLKAKRETLLGYRFLRCEDCNQALNLSANLEGRTILLWLVDHSDHRLRSLSGDDPRLSGSQIFDTYLFHHPVPDYTMPGTQPNQP